MRKISLISTLCLACSSIQACDPNSQNNRYLDCYALAPKAKQACVDRLIMRWTIPEGYMDPATARSIQFEAEKAEFKHFLNSRGLPCDSIDDGPIFNEDRKAYLVQCKPEYQYFMQFNYKTREWKLIDKEETDNER